MPIPCNFVWAQTRIFTNSLKTQSVYVCIFVWLWEQSWSEWMSATERELTANERINKQTNETALGSSNLFRTCLLWLNEKLNASNNDLVWNKYRTISLSTSSASSTSVCIYVTIVAQYSRCHCCRRRRQRRWRHRYLFMCIEITYLSGESRNSLALVWKYLTLIWRGTRRLFAKYFNNVKTPKSTHRHTHKIP